LKPLRCIMPAQRFPLAAPALNSSAEFLLQVTAVAHIDKSKLGNKCTINDYSKKTCEHSVGIRQIAVKLIQALEYYLITSAMRNNAAQIASICQPALRTGV